jgi:hypothetical protein
MLTGDAIFALPRKEASGCRNLISPAAKETCKRLKVG